MTPIGGTSVGCLCRDTFLWEIRVDLKIDQLGKLTSFRAFILNSNKNTPPPTQPTLLNYLNESLASISMQTPHRFVKAYGNFNKTINFHYQYYHLPKLP